MSGLVRSIPGSATRTNWSSGWVGWKRESRSSNARSDCRRTEQRSVACVKSTGARCRLTSGPLRNAPRIDNFVSRQPQAMLIVFVCYGWVGSYKCRPRRFELVVRKNLVRGCVKHHIGVRPEAHILANRSGDYGFPRSIKYEFALRYAGGVDVHPPPTDILVHSFKVRIGGGKNKFQEARDTKPRDLTYSRGTERRRHARAGSQSRFDDHRWCEPFYRDFHPIPKLRVPAGALQRMA